MFLCHVIFDQLTESQRLLRSEQKRWHRSICWWMFLCHVIFDQLTEWQRLLRSKAKEVNRSLMYECSFAMWSSISWPSRNVCFEVSKRGEQKSDWMNVPLPCDLRSADRVATFASKWAKEVNRSVVYKVPLPCDLRSADRVATFASKWAKEVHRSLVYKVPLPMWSSDQLTESQRWLRSEQKRWTEVLSWMNVHLQCDLPISWPSRTFCFEVSKRGEQKCRV